GARPLSVFPGENLAVLLDPRRAQALHAPAVDRLLPAEEFLGRQAIARQRLLQRQQPAAHGGDHLGLAPDDPALGARRRKIRQGQRRSSRTDHVHLASAVKALLLQHGLKPHSPPPWPEATPYAAKGRLSAMVKERLISRPLLIHSWPILRQLSILLTQTLPAGSALDAQQLL